MLRQFRAMVAGCWGAECRFWRRSLAEPLLFLGEAVQQVLNTIFIFFFCKNENPFLISFSHEKLVQNFHKNKVWKAGDNFLLKYFIYIYIKCSLSQRSQSLYFIQSLIWQLVYARFQQYVNCELPDVQADFGKGRGTRDQIANIRWIMEKAGEFQSISALFTMAKPLTVWITINWKTWEYQTT